MKNLLVLLFLATTFIIGIADVRADSDAPIKLGVLAPFSGDFASYGNFIRSGAELAKESLKASGIQIELIYEDACLPAQAVSSAQKLTNIDRVSGIAASYCVIGTNAIAPILERTNTLLFHTSPIPGNILANNKNVLTTNVRIEDEGTVVANYAFKELGLRRAASIHFDSQWGQTFADSFESAFTTAGGKVLVKELFPIDAVDMRPVLSRIRSANVDTIFIADIANRAGVVMKQARNLGITAKFLSVDEAEDPAVLASAGNAADGLVYFSPEPIEPSPEILALRTKYKSVNSVEAPSLATNTYDATLLLAQALSACSNDSNCARNKLLATKDYPGMSGTFSIDRDGGTIKGFVRKTVRKGAFVRAD